MEVPQRKDEKEFSLLFSQLKPLNKNYALGVLRSLCYAQECLPPKEKSSKTEDIKADGACSK